MYIRRYSQGGYITSLVQPASVPVWCFPPEVTAYTGLTCMVLNIATGKTIICHLIINN